jgi:hypothetical protein
MDLGKEQGRMDLTTPMTRTYRLPPAIVVADLSVTHDDRFYAVNIW